MKKMTPTKPKAITNSKSHNTAQSFIQSDTTNQSDSRKVCDSILLIPQDDKRTKTGVDEYNYGKPLANGRANLIQAPASSRIDFSKINSKVYIKVINSLFKYLKKVLATDLYGDVKRQFSESVHKCLSKSYLYILRDDESQSSIFNYIKSEEMVMNSERLLKMSYDFTPGKDKPVKVERNEINNKRNNSASKANCEGITATNHQQNKSQRSNTINVIESPSVLSKQIKQSLYNLTKGRVTLLNTPSMPKSHRNKSKTKELSLRSKTQFNSKGISVIGKPDKSNVSLFTCQPAKVNKTQYYSHKKDRKADLIITSDKSVEIKTVKRNKPKSIMLNSKLCSKVNSDNKSEISVERGGSAAKTQRSSRSAHSNKKSSEGNSKGNSKLTSFIFTNQQQRLNNNADVKIKTQYIDLARSDDNRLTSKSDEMLRLIKLSLDDNLKLMFNFSYEQFLSKESKTPSKKSQEVNELSAEIEPHTPITIKTRRGQDCPSKTID